MKKLIKIYYALLYLLPAILFFSYYPIISFGQTESMNLEISLPLIWLTIFDGLSFVLLCLLFRKKREIFNGILWRKFFFFSLFPLYITLSIFWSFNTLRAILTTGILWLLFFAIISIVLIQNNLPEPKKFHQTILKSILVSTVVICCWCWIQCLLDLAGCPRSQTLLCAGCTSGNFGFPHPNGFAIEPQFMGNLLLAPTILAAYFWLTAKVRRKSYLAFFVFFSATLFLTFSRGAIYSFVLAFITLVIVATIKQRSAKPLLLCLATFCSFLFTLNFQGMMSQFSYTNDTYQTGIMKSLDQLSLGVFHLNQDSESDTPSESQSQSTVVDDSELPSSTFNGYVEESTNVRLSLTDAALTAWAHGGINIILFGVGIGGAGTYLYAENFISSPKEIVQNQYASLLLETGLVGVLLLLSIIVICVRIILKSRQRHLYLSLILAYACSLFFFAGLPNALHIYLMPAVISKTKIHAIIKK